LSKQLKATKLSFLSIATTQTNGLNISLTDAGMFNGQLTSSAFHHYFEDDIIKGVERTLEKQEWPVDAKPLSEIEAEIEAIDEQIQTLTAQRDAIADDLVSTGLTE
jgi:hypothetical protein